jgi:hypothetical protein
MSTTATGMDEATETSHGWFHGRRDSASFSPEEWLRLLDEDRIALSRISLLLTAIVACGMLGMLVVVAILALG